MLARTASTEKGSVQSSIRIKPPAPTASPVRRIVPRLPGSRSRSATIQRSAELRFKSASGVSRSGYTPMTACGLSFPDSLARMSLLVRNTSPPAASVAAESFTTSGCAALSDANQSISGTTPASSASVRMRKPSARNRPSARRCFLSRSDLTRLTSGFEKPEISRCNALVLAELGLDEIGKRSHGRLRPVTASADRHAIAHRRA